MTVLSAHGAVLEREYAFGVVLQLLEPVAANQSRRSAMFAGAAGAARTVFEPGGVVASAPGATFAVVHGLFWTIANMSAEGPLLVSVDDLQWADEVSLRFLDFLRGVRMIFRLRCCWRCAATRQRRSVLVVPWVS